MFKICMCTGSRNCLRGTETHGGLDLRLVEVGHTLLDGLGSVDPTEVRLLLIELGHGEDLLYTLTKLFPSTEIGSAAL